MFGEKKPLHLQSLLKNKAEECWKRYLKYWECKGNEGVNMNFHFLEKKSEKKFGKEKKDVSLQSQKNKMGKRLKRYLNYWESKDKEKIRNNFSFL